MRVYTAYRISSSNPGVCDMKKVRTHLVREASGRSRDRRHAVDSNDCSPPFPWRSSERPLLGSYRSWPIVIVLERTRTAIVSVLSQTSPGSS